MHVRDHRDGSVRCVVDDEVHTGDGGGAVAEEPKETQRTSTSGVAPAACALADPENAVLNPRCQPRRKRVVEEGSMMLAPFRPKLELGH
jgi:hypothetical protein